MRANRARRRRAAERGADDTGTVEVEESDRDSSDEEDVVVGGVHYQLGKRKRYREAITQEEGPVTGEDLKIGETVQVGNMT